MIHTIKLKNLNMKKIFLVVSVILIYFLSSVYSFANASSYFDQGLDLFKNQELEKSKIFFEKDIVFYPKKDRSYMYLSKIFEKEDNEFEQEINLKNVLLINPLNDEAIYKLALLKINQSDFDEAKKLIKNFKLVCKSFCSKKDELEEKLKKSLPEDVKNNN